MLTKKVYVKGWDLMDKEAKEIFYCKKLKTHCWVLTTLFCFCDCLPPCFLGPLLGLFKSNWLVNNSSLRVRDCVCQRLWTPLESWCCGSGTYIPSWLILGLTWPVHVRICDFPHISHTYMRHPAFPFQNKILKGTLIIMRKKHGSMNPYLK